MWIQIIELWILYSQQLNGTNSQSTLYTLTLCKILLIEIPFKSNSSLPKKPGNNKADSASTWRSKSAHLKTSRGNRKWDLKKQVALLYWMPTECWVCFHISSHLILSPTYERAIILNAHFFQMKKSRLRQTILSVPHHRIHQWQKSNENLDPSQPHAFPTILCWGHLVVGHEHWQPVVLCPPTASTPIYQTMVPCSYVCSCVPRHSPPS